MVDLIVFGVASCILGLIGARLLDHGYEEARRDPRDGTPFA